MAHLFRLGPWLCSMAIFHQNTESEHPEIWGFWEWDGHVKKGFLLPEDQTKNWMSDLKTRAIPTYLNISLANMGDNYDTDGISDMP